MKVSKEDFEVFDKHLDKDNSYKSLGDGRWYNHEMYQEALVKNGNFSVDGSSLDNDILKILLEYNEYLFTFIDRDNVAIGTEKEDIIKWYNEHYREIN